MMERQAMTESIQQGGVSDSEMSDCIRSHRATTSFSFMLNIQQLISSAPSVAIKQQADQSHT